MSCPSWTTKSRRARGSEAAASLKARPAGGAIAPSDDTASPGRPCGEFAITEPLPPELRHPPFLVYALAAIGAAGAVLLLLGWLIGRGSLGDIDRAILLAAHGPRWLTLALVDVTALGGLTVLTFVVAAAAGLLAVQRHWLTLGLVLGGTISGSIAVETAKALVGRARPALSPHLVTVTSASFPSGHAANSAIVYLTLALLIVQITERRAVRAYILGAAALLVFAIGCSRVVLGVHWPSDVVAGWSFGALWAAAWWALGAWLRIRRARLG